MCIYSVIGIERNCVLDSGMLYPVFAAFAPVLLILVQGYRWTALCTTRGFLANAPLAVASADNSTCLHYLPEFIQ